MDIVHLHVALIGPYPVFIKKAVKSLFIDSSLRELDLGVLPVRGVDDGGAADLGDLLAVSVEAPAADLAAADDVLDEEDPVAEAERELVEQLDVLEDVVVARPGVAVLVVVTVDQQLHDRLHHVGRYQGLLLFLGRYQRNPGIVSTLKYKIDVVRELLACTIRLDE